MDPLRTACVALPKRSDDEQNIGTLAFFAAFKMRIVSARDAAIGLSILIGNTAQLSVGQAGFFAIGAYAAAYLTTTANWNYVPAAIVGTLLATVAGIGVGFVSLRFRGHYLAMATLAFGLLVTGIVHETAALGGPNGISNVPYPTFGSVTVS